MAGKNRRYTISEAARRVGVSTKTILRWEKARRIPRIKRDWRGWRAFSEQQIQDMIEMRQQLY